MQDCLDESLMSHDGQIRESQGKDTYDYIVLQRIAVRSMRLKRGSKTTSVADVLSAKKRLEEPGSKTKVEIEADKANSEDAEEVDNTVGMALLLELSRRKTKRKQQDAGRKKKGRRHDPAAYLVRPYLWNVSP